MGMETPLLNLEKTDPRCISAQPTDPEEAGEKMDEALIQGRYGTRRGSIRVKSRYMTGGRTSLPILLGG